ncbi:O-methyltransferase [Paracoccaceae bacterium GXU_MW_L88]
MGDAILTASRDPALDPFEVSPLQARFLALLAAGAERVLEIGTLGGYSAVQMARADAHVTTLEIDARAIGVAKTNFARAGLEDRITLLEGPAQDSLDAMIADEVAPFDLIFVDADKAATPVYYERVMKLARRGTLIVFDNVVREGGIADASSTCEKVRGLRTAMEMIKADDRVMATALQTVGVKGWDGMVLLRVLR